MIRTVGLSATHMECRNLQESMVVMTDLLAFEKISEKPAEATLKHPNTHWLLVLHDGGPDAPAKQMHNHWGVRVRSSEEVDRAYEYLTAHKAQYKLGTIGKPTWSHGSYSCYFVEPGTNGWEIECYEAFNRKETTAQQFGAVKMAHWSEVYPEDRFPGRGYVPQGFTHGTLVATDLDSTREFYADVLGLEVHRFSDHVIYVKHPNTRTFVVCALRKDFKVFSPNFRNTLTVASKEAVQEAYLRFSESGRDWGVRELFPLEENGISAAFCFRDPGTNCWEIASPNRVFYD
ncbi:MAG: VOC family protein [Deltaproteobacteria bacterium]|nr:VOC family protein [Deltaproteobacteria bacterium]MDZ4342910.1 VOC family protein [Candidatus Binatia bacterium]